MGSTVGGVPAPVWTPGVRLPPSGGWVTCSVAFSAGSFTQEASSPSGPSLSQNATRSPTLRVCVISHPLRAGGVGTSGRLWDTQTETASPACFFWVSCPGKAVRVSGSHSVTWRTSDPLGVLSVGSALPREQ